MRACTVDMHFNISQEPLYTEIYRKKVKPRRRLCASLRSQNALKFNISQVPLHTEIYRKKNASQRSQSEHPDQAPAFAPTVRTPQCRYTVRGKIEDDHVDTSVVVANVINQSWNEGTQLLNLRRHSGYLCGFGPLVLGHLVGR